MIAKRWIKFLNILSALIAESIPSAFDAFLIETQRMIRIEKTLGALKKTGFLVWTPPVRIPIFGLITGKSAHELSSCKHPITLAVISFDENRGGIYLKERMNTVRQSAFPINVRIHFNMLSDLVIDVLNPSHSASVEE